MTLIDVLENWREEELKSELITYRENNTETKLTRGEFRTKAHAIASEISRLAGPGDRALMVFPPGPEFLCAFYGAMCAGVTAVPVYPPSSRPESLKQFLALTQDSQPKVVLTTADIEARLKQTELSKFPTIATEIIPDSQAAQYRRPDIDEESVAYLQYTSGSTGTPRGVVHSHRNVLANMAFIRRAMDVVPTTRYVLWLPLYHDMGLISFFVLMHYGSHVSLMSPLSFARNPMDWLRAISRDRATHSGAPNFAYQLCARRAKDLDETLDLSSWTHAFTGAEPVRAETLACFNEAFEEHGFRQEAFQPCYGLAEATLLVSLGPSLTKPIVLQVDKPALAQGRVVRSGPESDMQDLVACGKIHPDAEVAIVDPDSFHRKAPDEIGEIWVRGHGIGGGYWRRSEESELTFHASIQPDGDGPYLRTGDLGFADGGQLVVTGRIKDLIVIRGRNYYPHDIELVMGEAHEAIRDDRCIAFSLGGLEQEEVAVFFELQRGLHKDLDLGSVMTAVREAISESCALSTCVIGVVEDGALPRTSSGKVRRSSCREAFLANELPLLAMEGENPAQDQPVAAPPETADPDVPDLEEVQACLVREISQIIGHSVDADAIITRIGINSVDAIDIMFEIEDRFGLAIDPESLNDSISIAELARRAVAGVSSEQAVVVTTPPGTASEVPVVHARPLDVSLMYFSTDTLDSDARLDLLLEGAKFADQHDFAAVWIPERHFHPFGGTYPNPSVAAAALAVITKNVRLRAGSVVVPLHNPVRIAEEWALVDNLSKGRVDLAFATGWNPDDFALAPRSFDNRRAITMASIKEVQRLWSGEPTILVNGNGTSVPISIYPRPIQSQFGSWLTCTSSIDGFVEAGKLGYNVLTALLFQRTEDLSEKITAYRQAREQHGHDPETGRVTLMLHTFVGPTEETVHEVVKPAFKRYLASSADAWKGEWSDLVGDDGAPSDKLLELAYQRYTHGNSLIGTPADCASHATRLQDLGVDEVACLIDFGVEPSVTLEALNHLNEMRLLCKAETDRRIAAD